MRKFHKIIDGNDVVVVWSNGGGYNALIGGLYVSNPSIDMLLADGYEEVIPQPYIPTIAEAIANKLAELSMYDSSDSVNTFYINGVKQDWIHPNDRCNYILTMQAALAMSVTSIPFAGYNIAPADAISILNKLNIYAMQCVAVTNTHKVSINALTTIEDVNAYDFATGYPAVPSFTIQTI